MQARAVRIRTIALAALLVLVSYSYAMAGGVDLFGFEFPDSLGGFGRVGDQDYEAEYPGMGKAVWYSGGATKATVYLYTMGNSGIANGTASGAVHAALLAAQDEIKAMVERGYYSMMMPFVTRESLLEPTDPASGALYSDFIVEDSVGRWRSFVYVRGQGGYIVKVRISSLMAAESEAPKDRAGFLSALWGVIGKRAGR